MEKTAKSAVHKSIINKSTKPNKSYSIIKQILYNRYLYLLFIPTFVYYIIFAYVPMYGATLAFKEFDFSKGIVGSPWAEMHGLKHFFDIMNDAVFKKAFVNTLIISAGRIFVEFPVPIILALLINEIRNAKYRRFIQTVFTFPHFVSWIIVAGLFFNLFSHTGVINQFRAIFRAEPISPLTNAPTFRWLLFGSDSWKEAGWNTIIYLAAISSVNIELYEAAHIDGAKRFQLVRYITWPAMKTVIGVLLVLQVANIMNAGFDQIFNMYNPAVYDVSDIIDTFIYRRTFVTGMDFSSSTAIGLFKSIINFIMLFSADKIVKKTTGKGIY